MKKNLIKLTIANTITTKTVRVQNLKKKLKKVKMFQPIYKMFETGKKFNHLLK